MRPHELIERLDNLLPEIKRTGDPEGTLLKFAASENLAPAQLEKMAQLFNTAKTLTYMGKAASRGGSFTIINTEELLGKYTDTDDLRKAASGPHSWEDKRCDRSKAASGDGLAAWIDQPEDDAVSESHFPDMELMEMRAGLRKAAAAMPTPEVVFSAAEQFAIKCASDRNLDTLKQVRADSMADAVEGFQKVADALRMGEIPFEEVEEDALGILGQEAAGYIGQLSDYLGHAHVKHARLQGASRRRVAIDRYDMMPMLKSAFDALDMVAAADELIKGATQAPVAPPETSAEPEDEPVDWERPAQTDIDTGLRRLGINPAPASGGDQGGPRSDEDTSRRTAHKVKGGTGKEPGEGAKAEPNPMADELNKGWDSFIEGGNKTRPVTGTMDKVKELLGVMAPGRNKKQENVDRSVDDEQFVTGLQRLLVTDPILAEADPARVTDLANSIRQINPDVAGDVNQLRHVLREAIQYDALPQHTAKDLTGMRKDRAQAEVHERSNARDEYDSSFKPARP